MTPDPEEQPPSDYWLKIPRVWQFEFTPDPSAAPVFKELPKPIQSLIRDIQNQNPQNN